MLYRLLEKDMLSVETTPRFDNELMVILDFIALDSSNRALLFYDELMQKLYDIPNHPYIYRQRSDKDTDTRELIYKGYVIPFYIDKIKHKIFILGIFNQNIWD